VLAEADACTEPGELGALLRRYGLYSSHLTTWRHQRDAGELAGLAPRRRGRKVRPKNELAGEVARLERELRKAMARAERAEGLVAVQKKLAELLGEELPSEEELLEAERRGLPIPPPRRKR
jgi:transposase InsO family protein